ncbi:MAG TPA: tyrosine--tRNA ligase [Candidatus Peribacteraceae bacterium]|nr:tyrosine--tRNA ligase [Candidatus Peribacteraceae bacterium]
MKNNDLLTRAVSEVIPKKLAEEKLKSGKPLRLYLGIDPTGAKLHLGHSVPLRKLKAFQDAGHHVIFLVGSFTALVGDPTGRDEMREPLTKEQVEKNFQTYKQQAGKILDFSKVELRYNHEWLGKMNFAEIMNLASHFTVQQMLERDMFQKRMSIRAACPQCQYLIPVMRSLDAKRDQIKGEYWPWDVECPECHKKFKPKVSKLIEEEPVSPNEFLYPLMQGYDSVVLDVDFEVGGNDQLFNMLCGRKLQKAFGKREKFVLTTKLIEGTDGRKMSKTYNNCIYLEDEANDMFGKVMSVKDELMETYFECCTEVPMDEVKKILRGNPRDAKARLASEIVSLYHGAKAAEAAGKEFESVFKKGELPENMPETTVKKGTLLLDVLVSQGLISSKSEARRLVEQNGIQMNDHTIHAVDLKAEEGIAKVGKRKFLRISLS